MSDENTELKTRLAEKEKEIDEIMLTFTEIKQAYETLNIRMQEKDLQIQTLKSNVDMKETQINTISSVIKTKDDFISSLQDTLKMKENQIETLNELGKTKEKEVANIKREIEKLNENSVDTSVINEKDQKIKEMEKEIKLLHLDLKTADDEAIELGKKLDELEQTEKSKDKSGEILSTNASREAIIKFMAGMLSRALHNVNITTPSISDLAELELYDVKGQVQIKASCHIDPTDSEHKDLLEEFNALDNIYLRNFDEKDRWICLKDSEEMFIASMGENNNNLAFYSNDSKHIRFFNSLIMESWLRAKKI